MDHKQKQLCRLRRREKMKKLFPRPERKVKRSSLWRFTNLVCKPLKEKPKEDRIPNPFLNGNAFIRRLIQKGWKSLGSGCFSTVLEKDPNSKRVLRINCRPTDGWKEYAYWSRNKGYAGSFAPKVYSYKLIKGMKGQKETFAIASVERLKCTISRDAKTAAGPVTSLLYYLNPKRVNVHAQKMVDTAIPGVSSFVTELYNEFKGSSFDFHGGNFMLREDDSLVFTDPIAGGCSHIHVPLRFKEHRVH